jgi:hypothetical protein
VIADLKPYPGYKESEQAWLGLVPEHWLVLPDRALFVEVKDREHTNEEMLSVTITKGIIRQKTLLTDSSNRKTARRKTAPGRTNRLINWSNRVTSPTTKCGRGRVQLELLNFAGLSVPPTLSCGYGTGATCRTTFIIFTARRSSRRKRSVGRTA